jgi:hypothetical protein
MDEVTGEWGMFHSEELHNFNSSPDIIRQINSEWERDSKLKKKKRWQERNICYPKGLDIN